MMHWEQWNKLLKQKILHRDYDRTRIHNIHVEQSAVCWQIESTDLHSSVQNLQCANVSCTLPTLLEKYKIYMKCFAFMESIQI